MPKRFGFAKGEHLKSRKQIERLFAEGKSLSVFPVRAVYQFSASAEPGLKAGVSASKRYFKKAVDRNRIKRLLREAYRLQKEALVARAKAAGIEGAIFFLYTDNTIADFETVKTAVGKCLQRMQKTIQLEDPS